MMNDERQRMREAQRLQTQAGMFAFAMVCLVCGALAIGFTAGRNLGTRQALAAIEIGQTIATACGDILQQLGQR